MARQLLKDAQGRDYRYNPDTDEQPRRIIKGYSFEKQGGANEARARDEERRRQSREKSQQAVNRTFGGLNEFYQNQRRPAAPQAATPMPPKPLPETIRRPAAPMAPTPGPVAPRPTAAQRTVEKIVPESSYKSTLAEMLAKARRA